RVSVRRESRLPRRTAEHPVAARDGEDWRPPDRRHAPPGRRARERRLRNHARIVRHTFPLTARRTIAGMRLFQIDAFTDAAFRGNPAGVCLLDNRDVDDTWMQNVAAEMNVSETAFARRNQDDWSLRWFTPTVEVALCGHATLATAHALFEERLLSAGGTARFHTK